MDLEAQPIEENTNAVDAIASLMSEEQEPEGAATPNELEETTLSENEPELTDEGEEIAEVIEALNLADFDQEQKVQFGDDVISLADLQEIYSNRTATSVLDGQRAELAELRKQLDERKEKHGYVDQFDKPHEFLNAVLPKWIESGAMSQDAAARFVDAFNGLITDNLYNMESVNSLAAEKAKQAEFAAREAELERKAREAELKIELAQAAAKYGELSDDIKQEAMGVIQDSYNRTGELMSLTAAFEVLDGKGKFNKAPATRAKLADSLRRSGTVVEQKAGNDLSAESALKNLLK